MVSRAGIESTTEKKTLCFNELRNDRTYQNSQKWHKLVQQRYTNMIDTSTLLSIASRPDGERRIAAALAAQVMPREFAQYTKDQLYEALERIAIQNEK